MEQIATTHKGFYSIQQLQQQQQQQQSLLRSSKYMLIAKQVFINKSRRKKHTSI